MRASPLPSAILLLAPLTFAAGVSAQGFHLDYEPAVREAVLDTDFTQVQPKNGPPVQVTGGVFMFRNVRIHQGVTVRGTGSKPMIWVVSGDFVVDGLLTVSGGQGNGTDTLSSANFPTAGGVGVCGGGDGGNGSPSTVARSTVGGRGRGAGHGPLIGGAGGFGGMGVVQLHVPYGQNTDGTNTILDDGIRVFKDGVQVFGQEKQRYIAWRGFPDSNGVMVDDSGNPTDIGDGEGDIRPTPVLLPILQ